MTNHTKNNKLFTVTFNPFSVTLLQPLSVTTDPYTLKRELKKALIEIRDTVSGPLILSWSGGFDSAFAVLCYLDLIDEGKLTKDSYSISGARFTDGKTTATIDFARGERFLEYLNIDSYGIKVDLQEVIIDADFLKKCVGVCIENRSSMIGLAAQEVWRNNQDGCVIFHMGQTSFRNNLGGPGVVKTPPPGICSFIPFQFGDFKEDANSINIFTWNQEIFQSFITPYVLEAPSVEYDEVCHSNKYAAWAIDTQMGRNLIMLTCFPKLILLYPKLPTMNIFALDSNGNWALDHGAIHYVTIATRLVKRYEGGKPTHAYLKLPNGDYVTSIEQTQEFFT